MYEHDVLESDETAKALLLKTNPGFEKRFHIVCKMMKNYVEDVREFFPDARYYLKDEKFNLMLGDPKSGEGEPQEELIALEDRQGVGVEGEGF